MRSRFSHPLALSLSIAMLAFSLTPALAQDEPEPVGRAIGNAGTALGTLRLLPNSVPSDSILPDSAADLPEKSAYEAVFGLATAEADSEALLSYERAIARAAPFGGPSEPGTPAAAGTLLQTALPDHDKPATGAFEQPASPLDDLVRATGMRGTVHARWSPSEGPCVGTIAEAETESSGLAFGNAVPTVPDVPVRELPLPHAKGFTPPGGLGTLGGLLAGPEPEADGDGSLVSVPQRLSATSTVRLVDLEDGTGKAVQSTSTLRGATINLLQGAPLGMTVTVVRQPSLQATSTGTEASSTLTYTEPVLEVNRGSTRLFMLEAEQPSRDIPIGFPTKGFEELPDSSEFKPGPIVGGFGEKSEGGTARLSKEQQSTVTDLFVLRLSIAGLDKKALDMTAPYRGHQLSASARMLDVQLLPTEALADALGEEGEDIPSSLAQISIGEQVVRAYAPAGGVTCGATATPSDEAVAPAVPPRLAVDGTAYESVPMFWTGAAALLIGVVLVSAFPSRRRAGVPPRKPSPAPRSDQPPAE